MAAAFLLALREGLEAALVVGVAMSVLARMRRDELRSAAWAGVAVAALLSAFVGAGLTWVGAEVEGQAEEIFEGVTMLLAAGLLTWMILWMRSQGREIQRRLELDVRQAALKGHRRAVFAITFFAVLREGVETAIFLTAAAFRSDASGTLVGGLAGLATAVLLGWGLYSATLRLNIRTFFQVTGVLLLLFAAGLVGHGVHELNEAGLIPGLIDPIWDVSGVLAEDSPLGALLKALFGYNANPSLTEVLAYITYLLSVSLFVRPSRPRPADLAPVANGGAASQPRS
ncbi:MAG TPA: iron uptake transporter permease EfeU [Anaerolineales bacterium]|nr:iron uptake transporter permease EfeU [Anaerolineales bacterium]